MDVTMSKEPLTPAVPHGDEQWFDVVKLTIFAMINAEELGINSQNVDDEVAARVSRKAIEFLPVLPPQPSNLRDLARLAVRGSAREWIAVGVVTGLVALMTFFTPFLLGKLPELFTTDAPATAYAAIFIALLLVVLAGAAWQAVRALALLRARSRSVAIASGAVWERIMRLPAPWHGKRKLGDRLNQASSTNFASGAFPMGILHKLVLVLGKLDPDAMAQGMSSDPGFMKKLVGKLDPKVVAGVINENQTFLTRLMGKMNPRGTADAINDNVEFLSDLLDYLNPKVVAGVMNNASGATGDLVKYLDAKVIGYVVNRNGTFLTGLLGNLEPSVLANAINTAAGQAFLTALLNPDVGLNPAMMAQTQNNVPGFSKALMDPLEGIDPGVLADVINESGLFIRDLIGLLDAPVLNAAMDEATLRTYDDGGPKGMFYTFTDPVEGLNPSLIADIVNDNADFIGGLMGGMDPATTASILETDNGKNFLNTVVTGLGGNPAAMEEIADALATTGAMATSRQMMIALNPHAEFLSNQVNRPGMNNTLKMVTFKVWSDNDMLSSPYMFGTLDKTFIQPYPD